MLAVCGVLIGVVVLIFLDPLFIFVFHWGIKGAAAIVAVSIAIYQLEDTRKKECR